MNKELLVGVDEFSLVLFSPLPVESKAWLSPAFIIMNTFIDYSKIELLLGKVVEMHEKKPAAYTHAFTIENVPYYLAIATHEYCVHMGVLVRFSAEAWSEYQKAYYAHFGQKINIAAFLKMIDSGVYQTRLSRIDLTADYKNYGYLSPHSIYNKLKDENYQIVDCKGRNAKRKISAVQNDMTTSTFYVGSRKENSRLLLRVYNKKQEQIQAKGFRLEEAINCDSWVRFEASFRGNYAHQITEQLKNINNEIELSQFIASKICDKYRFTDVSTGEYTDFTKDLLSIVGDSNYSALRSENPKNNSLANSISHIIKGSGLYPLLFKIGQVWNEQTEVEFLEIIYQIYLNNYKKDMARDNKLINWIEKNYSSLSQQKLSDCFIGVGLSKIDTDKIVEESKNNDIFNLTVLYPRKTETTEEISDDEFEALFWSFN